jgi:hypothetical protein
LKGGLRVVVLPKGIAVVQARRAQKHMILYKAKDTACNGFMYTGTALDAGCNNVLHANKSK